MNALRQLGISLLIVLGLMLNIGSGMICSYLPNSEPSSVNDVTSVYASQVLESVSYIQTSNSTNPHAFNYRIVVPDWSSVNPERISAQLQPQSIGEYPNLNVRCTSQYIKLLYPFHEFS